MKNDLEHLTLKMVEEPVIPVSWNLRGPALVILSSFIRKTFRPVEIEKVSQVYDAFTSLGIQPAEGRKMKKELPENVSNWMLAKLGEGGLRVARQVYKLGHPMLDIYPCFNPLLTEIRDGTLVQRNTRIKRLHILFYDAQYNMFRMPGMIDRYYGYMFYAGDRNLTLSIKAAERKNGPEFAKFVAWRKEVHEELLEHSTGASIRHGIIKLGDMIYSSASTWMASQQVERGFKACLQGIQTITRPDLVVPKIELFNRHCDTDKIVFNGAPLPWAQTP